MNFDLTILGSNSATPAYGRFMTAQSLVLKDRHFLIDCAEGTQIRMQQFGVKLQRINHIFISHLHGDHIFGLPGLILSMSLNRRTEDLCIYSPPGLKELIDTQLRISESHLGFTINYTETNPEISQRLFEDELLTVDSIPLDHRVPAHGFLFREKPAPRKMRREKIEEYKIPFQVINDLKKGADWVMPDGTVVLNEELTLAPTATRSYAFCSDTRYSEKIIPYIKGVDLLYHEATFMHDMLENAELTGHSTALQAATIAKAAEVKKMIIGHFSARYSDLQALLAEAQERFPNTELAIDGTVYSIV